MTGYLVLAVLALAAVVWGHHRLTRFVPRNRVRSMRVRLHLRMRAARGMATWFELWLRWGRFAAYRSSKRIRPSLSRWQRMCRPDAHSARIGRAQRRMSLRVPYEEHKLVMAPPRTGKSALLSAVIMRHEGPVLATSSKPDLFALTSGIRARRGPLAVFNPGNVGGLRSTVQWSPVQGCEDRAVAMRRADAFAGAISMKGAEGGDYFAGKASSYLRALFHASALVGGDLRLVARWGLGSAEQAEQILTQSGAVQWAQELAELRGDARKSAATTQSVMSRALSWMNDESLAQAVMPGDFDIASFITQSGTIYLIAEAQEDQSPLSPLFACLANEFRHVASMLGQAAPGGRLDPPLRMALDEVVSICPVPLPTWLSDSGGKGISILTAAHSEAQLRSRWGADGGQAILDTSGVKIYLPGITDSKTLEAVSKTCGQMTQRQRGQDHHMRHPVIDESMLRSLPPGFGLVMRGGNTPVIAKLERGWKQRPYRQAKRRGQAVARTEPVAQPVLAVQVPERPAVEAFEDAPDPLRSMLNDTTPANAWGSA